MPKHNAPSETQGTAKVLDVFHIRIDPVSARVRFVRLSRPTLIEENQARVSG
jgi:hypothetical protein